MMRVLVCGDRNWADRERLWAYLDTIKAATEASVARGDLTIIEGEARGADSEAREWAKARGVAWERYPADWMEYGNAAGPIRNQQMLDEGKPDVVVYAHDDLEHSRGTADMVRRAKAAGVPIRRVP